MVLGARLRARRDRCHEAKRDPISLSTQGTLSALRALCWDGRGGEDPLFAQLDRHVAPPVGLEPTTRCLEGSRSIQLSYGGIASGTTVAGVWCWLRARGSRRSHADRV